MSQEWDLQDGKSLNQSVNSNLMDFIYEWMDGWTDGSKEVRERREENIDG